jgi:hypothetical protein
MKIMRSNFMVPGVQCQLLDPNRGSLPRKTAGKNPESDQCDREKASAQQGGDHLGYKQQRQHDANSKKNQACRFFVHVGGDLD